MVMIAPVVRKFATPDRSTVQMGQNQACSLSMCTASTLQVEYCDYSQWYRAKYGEQRTCVLMQVGSFYEVYQHESERDIKDIADVCNISIATKENGVQTCGSPTWAVEKYQLHGRRVRPRPAEHQAHVCVHRQSGRQSHARAHELLRTSAARHTHAYVRLVNWPIQSGVAISRKCCFQHGMPHDASRVKRACMPAVLKERACQPCLNGDVHVERNFRITR